jgi:predicted nucleotidyltransferase
MQDKIKQRDLINLFLNKCAEIKARPMFCVLSGSHAHGYDTAASDYDLRAQRNI